MPGNKRPAPEQAPQPVLLQRSMVEGVPDEGILPSGQVAGVINDLPTFRVDQIPYGGMKDSGVGREGPRFAIEEMTNLKMVVISMGG